MQKQMGQSSIYLLAAPSQTQSDEGLDDVLRSNIVHARALQGNFCDNMTYFIAINFYRVKHAFFRKQVSQGDIGHRRVCRLSIFSAAWFSLSAMRTRHLRWRGNLRLQNLLRSPRYCAGAASMKKLACFNASELQIHRSESLAGLLLQNSESKNPLHSAWSFGNAGAIACLKVGQFWLLGVVRGTITRRVSTALADSRHLLPRSR